MQQLHAYWRMDYIEAPRYPATMKRPFTELPALGDDRLALIVHRSTHTYLVLNRFPYNPGHLLAVPFRDVVEPEELDSEERNSCDQTLPSGPRAICAWRVPRSKVTMYTSAAPPPPTPMKSMCLTIPMRPRRAC